MVAGWYRGLPSGTCPSQGQPQGPTFMVPLLRVYLVTGLFRARAPNPKTLLGIYICVCMYVCMYACIYIYICMYVCIYVYVYVYIYGISMYLCNSMYLSIQIFKNSPFENSTMPKHPREEGKGGIHSCWLLVTFGDLKKKPKGSRKGRSPESKPFFFGSSKRRTVFLPMIRKSKDKQSFINTASESQVQVNDLQCWWVYHQHIYR